jgi:hypothetical protein
LLHRDEESIEVYMHDRARGHSYICAMASGSSEQVNAMNSRFGTCQNPVTMLRPL